MHESLSSALSSFTQAGSIGDRASKLFGALGYRSQRTVEIGGVDEFVELLQSEMLSDRQLELFNSWHSADIVFQITEQEIAGQKGLFQEFDNGRVQSFLFVAADLKEPSYTRTELAEMTRAVNRGFSMPVILLFRHGATLTLAAVHRRPHKRDDNRDVLERVALVKDIRPAQPHRAHVEILNDLELPRLLAEGVENFDGLHAAWERVLDIEALNRRFYRELFDWFCRAVSECRFPDDGAGNGSTERHVIRLITRLLFIWFLKEKALIPDALFTQAFARKVLRNYSPDRTDYYRAVLQNLFFATLNTEIHKRAFSKQTNATHRDFTKYRYRALLVDPEDFVETLKTVPFVNGGLFDCLDDFEGKREGGRRIDAFTDNPTQGQGLHVPASLLLDDPHGLFPLFRRYKFTVEENTPIDQEVALDPELLGRAFENLLAAYNPETRETARKTTGSYYTPRQVVDFMVQVALVEALTAKTVSADGDAKFWRERIEYLLDHSDAMDDANELFVEDERDCLITAVAGLKILDPAVGSGAFPIAVLQKLTLALRRLDPENLRWEKHQKKRAATRASGAFDTRDPSQRKEELKEISDTFEKYRQSDFGRKLYLIQNSVYGVDIQPIACQIAKLRFFISLAIEQEPHPNSANFGIKPLPNLETRFVAADTLIGLKSDTSSLLLSDAVLCKRKQVEDVRERYFLADSRPKKFECVRAERRLRGELRDILNVGRQEWRAAQERDINAKANELPDTADRKKYFQSELRQLKERESEYDNALSEARQVAEWDPYDQNACAGWFSAEYMFGVQDGFDVVIGNPPYIQLQKDRGRVGACYASAGFDSFTKKGDIYQLFYEQGCRLLKPIAGTLAYITSNSWLKAEYGKRLRRWFTENHRPLRLIEMGKDVFDAIVDTNILFVREGGIANNFPAVDVDHLRSGVFPPLEEKWGEVRPQGEEPWSTLSGVEWRVLEKMRAVGTPLKDWNVRINYGIKTGYNEAFITDHETRDALIGEDSRSDEIIKPVLKGSDIKRWRAQWKQAWLIVAKFGSHGSLADDYPAVYRHLAKHEKALRARGQCRYTRSGRAQSQDYDGQHHWLELDNNPKDEFIDLFGKEKLFWIELADQGRFSFDGGSFLGKQQPLSSQANALNFYVLYSIPN